MENKEISQNYQLQRYFQLQKMSSLQMEFVKPESDKQNQIKQTSKRKYCIIAFILLAIFSAIIVFRNSDGGKSETQLTQQQDYEQPPQVEFSSGGRGFGGSHFYFHPIFIVPHIPYNSQNNHKKSESTSSLSFKVNCSDYLAYSLTSFYQTFLQYNKWYAKYDKNLNGKTYQPGFLFNRWIAVNNKCTEYQSKYGKTVFYDWNETLKAFNNLVQQRSHICDVGSDQNFYYKQDTTIKQGNQKIKGIDCRAKKIKYFSKLSIEYKKAVNDSNPTQGQYLKSQNLTIWNFYPIN